MSEEIKIEYRPLAELARWKRNPKGHDIPALKSSIRRWGFINPLIEDGTARRIVAGHGRLEALLAMQQAGEEPPARIKVNGKGEWLAPIVTGVSFETELDAEAFLLADNRLVELGGWEQAGLTSMLEDLQLAGVADGTGWTDQEIANMLLLASSREPAAQQDPKDVQFRAYDEGDASKVKMAECPQCQHKFPL